MPPLVKQAIDAGLPPEQILNQGLIAGMSEVGRLFESGEFFVPEMLISARAMKAGLELLRPALAAANVQAIGKVVLGTVQADLHDIGKNLVGLSALLTTTMPKMKATVEALQESGLRPSVKVMIGGAPVTDKYAGDIGADIYAPDASSAATRARQAMA